MRKFMEKVGNSGKPFPGKIRLDASYYVKPTQNRRLSRVRDVDISTTSERSPEPSALLSPNDSMASFLNKGRDTLMPSAIPSRPSKTPESKRPKRKSPERAEVRAKPSPNTLPSGNKKNKTGTEADQSGRKLVAKKKTVTTPKRRSSRRKSTKNNSSESKTTDHDASDDDNETTNMEEQEEDQENDESHAPTGNVRRSARTATQKAKKGDTKQQRNTKTATTALSSFRTSRRRRR